MPRPCPVCWLDGNAAAAVLVALLCAESYYSIARRFHLPPMAAWRHERNCLVGVSRWRELAKEKGPGALRGQLVHKFPSLAAAIDDWIAGNRPIMPRLEDLRAKLPRL